MTTKLPQLFSLLLVMQFCSGCPTSPTEPVAPEEPVVVENQPETLRAPEEGDWFEDVTPTTGVEFQYSTGVDAGLTTILETVGGGLGAVDYDLDGLLDLVIAAGGTIDTKTAQPSGLPCPLFRNLGGWRFQDVGEQAHLPKSMDYSHGCYSADFDNDGFPDMLLTCFGRNTLLHNLGDGTFEDVTLAAPLNEAGWHTAAAFGDVNRDGNLDLFVANYVDWTPNPDELCPGPDGGHDVCPPQRYLAQPDLLYVSEGDGGFENASEQSSIRTDGKGLGVVSADFNDDGYADFYVANDEVQNHFYLGGPSLPLQEIGEISGTAFNHQGTAEGSMGVDAEDIDGDGHPELWVTNFELEDNSLLHNVGSLQFQHATTRFQLAGHSRMNVGFGTGFHDWNLDGWPDLYVLNGHVRYHSSLAPFRQKSMLLQNLNGIGFEDLGAAAGNWLELNHTARSGAVGDFDNDGMLDLAINCLDEPVSLLRNRMSVEWLRIRLIGVHSSRDAIGAKVIISNGEHALTRLIKSGSGYFSQSDQRVTVPYDVGNTVEVHWPSGLHEQFKANTSGDVRFVEGSGTPLNE